MKSQNVQHGEQAIRRYGWLLPILLSISLVAGIARAEEAPVAVPEVFETAGEASDQVNSQATPVDETSVGETSGDETRNQETADDEIPDEEASIDPTPDDQTLATEDDELVEDEPAEAFVDEAPLVEVKAVFPVTSSPEDPRQYRYLTLSNNLRVLLISDPTTEKSAAALDVNIGHNQNPWNRPGLAHFLEHMLFLGTAKYPQAGDYPAFIAQHGGRYNAYTAAEHTNYFFEVDSAHFQPALDRFGWFFIAPLFDARYVERERNAVDSEYRMRLKDDGRRTLDVYRELMNSNHPLSAFTVGNHETLADAEEETIRDELIRFYQRYYSASLMSLVILGKEPLDELQQMAMPIFGRIPSHSVSLPATYPAMFRSDFLPAKVDIKPRKELRQLTFLFPVPDVDVNYRKKPYEFIAHLLGHEGEGSLLSFLRQLGWAESLSAGVGLKSRHDGLFQITIDLTEKGWKARNQIPVVVFHVIKQLEARGLKEWRYQELQQMADINFRYQEKMPPMDTVRQLAPAMHVYTPEDTLVGDTIFKSYDEKLIRQSLGWLRADNVLLASIAPDAATARSSRYYQTPYIADSWIIEDAEVKPSMRKRLFFPEENVFIPSRLEVRSRPLLPSPENTASEEQVAAPQRVLSNQRAQVWFQQDQVFDVPRAHMYLRVKSPLVARDASGAAQAALFAALVEDQLNEFSWPARLAGLDYSLTAHARGFDLHIAGYSNRQGLLLNKVAESIRKAQFTQERFAIRKAALLREWKNRDHNSPYQVLLPKIAALQVSPLWNDDAMVKALENKTWEQFRQFSQVILRDASLEALFYGNLFRQEAIKLASLAEHQLLGVRTGRTQPSVKIVQLSPEGRPWLYRQPIQHNDNIALLYTQALDDTVYDAAHMQVLRQILQPAFFDQLRTEKQLGYVVSLVPLPLRTLEGSAFVVQSPTIGEAELVKEIDEFLSRQKSAIAANLGENREAISRRLREPSRSLAEQADRFWNAIVNGDYDFQRQASLAEAVDAVTEETLADYYQAAMLNSARRLWLTSDRMPVPEGFRMLEDEIDYRAEQTALTYP